MRVSATPGRVRGYIRYFGIASRHLPTFDDAVAGVSEGVGTRRLVADADLGERGGLDALCAVVVHRLRHPSRIEGILLVGLGARQGVP